MKCEIFCEDVPRTAENFLALCASEYYNSSSFHRNIKARPSTELRHELKTEITRAFFRFVLRPWNRNHYSLPAALVARVINT